MRVASQYKMGFTAKQWEEIEGMGFEGFAPTPDKALSRVHWIAIAHMALGKAQRIEDGTYGGGAEGEDEDDGDWEDELRAIASKILNKFRRGDGQM